MQCPDCHSSNCETDEFCGQCGVQLMAGSSEPVINETPAESLTENQLAEALFYTGIHMPVKAESGCATHTGHIKSNNEDAVLVKAVEYPLHGLAVRFSIIADGMGDPPAGEIFAELAVHETWLRLRALLPHFELQSQFLKWDFWLHVKTQIENGLITAVSAVNARVHDFVQASGLPGGATFAVTVTLCDLETGHVELFGYNEGDCRTVLVLGDEFIQLSNDHTIEGAPVRYFGKSAHISGTQVHREFWMAELGYDSFWIVSYSDGLWNMLSPKEIIEILQQHYNPQHACNALLEAALATSSPAGKEADDRVQTGDDNITVTTTQITKQES